MTTFTGFFSVEAMHSSDTTPGTSFTRSLTVGVEGMTEQSALPVLFALATGRTMEASGITLWSCGCDAKALRFVRTMAAAARNVALVVDADCRFRPALQAAVAAVRDLGPGRVHWLGAPREFEELFTDRQWAAVADSVYPRRDGRRWVAGDVARCREEGKFSSLWRDEVRTRAGLQRLGKPELAVTLATSLDRADEVPVALREVFDDLLALGATRSDLALAA